MKTQTLLIVAALAGAGYVAVRRSKMITETLNPTSRENAAYKTVNSVGESLTGQQNWNLGSWIWGATNREQLEYERSLKQ